MFVLSVIKKYNCIVKNYVEEICIFIIARMNVRSLCWLKKATQYYFLIDAQEHSQISSK